VGAAARRLTRALGRRGVALLILGAGKVCFGIGVFAAPQPDPRGLSLLTDYAPLHCWAWVWVLCGAITFASAFLRIGRDRWGFVAALLPPALWGVAYAVGAANGEYVRGWYVFGWYATSHVGLIVWAAAVPEHSVPHPRRREKGSP
jgi:hypothetical protein